MRQANGRDAVSHSSASASGLNCCLNITFRLLVTFRSQGEAIPFGAIYEGENRILFIEKVFATEDDAVALDQP